MSAAHTPSIDVDRMVAEAQKRLAAFISRTAAQQTRRMRETWANADAVGHIATGAQPTYTNTHTAHRPTATPVRPMATVPWLDDITALDDTDDDMALADAALMALAVCCLVLCAGFAAGYLVGSHLV